MLGLIVTNLRRHRGRTMATALGIALGVATIVALLSVGSGLRRTAGELIHLGRADFGVFQKGVGDPTASVLPASLAERLERQPDIAHATPLLLIVEGIRDQPAAVVFGADPEGFFAKRTVITEGANRLGADRILVGDGLAAAIGLRPGAELTVKRRTFTVSGVYHTGIFFEDRGAILDLPTAQRLARRPAEATTIAVQAESAAPQATAESEVRSAAPGVQVIGTADDAARAGANGALVDNAVKIIGALALIVGGLGVANTMAMTVLERERELALLSAVGWPRVRVATLVIAEGIATSMLGAALGLLLGVLGARWLGDVLQVSAVVSPRVTPWTIGQGLLIGVAIGVLGGLYPAWRGTTVSGAKLLGRA
jgi:putative ABC transport system permease protein